MPAVDDVISALVALREHNSSGQSGLTATQAAAFANFPGWGPVAPALDDDPPPAWGKKADALAQAARGVDLTGALDTVDTSFYTPSALVRLLWDVLVRAGFTGGRVLDIGCGTGRFLAGAPVRLRLDYTGVEVEPVSAQIASHLHPAARIVVGDATTAQLGANFDVAIGNLPFSSSQVYLPGGHNRMPLHTACMMRAVSALRPGALGVFVASRHILDGARGDSIGHLNTHADLVCAVRLPSGYFAGTDVVADVLVVQARRDLQAPPQGWPDVRDRMTVGDDSAAGSGSVTVSGYWRNHPRHVAGTMEATGYDPAPLRVVATNRTSQVARALAAATRTLPKASPDVPVPPPSVVLEDHEGRLEGSFHVVDGQVVRVTDGRLAPVLRPSRELLALISMRDKAVALLAAEADWDCPDSSLDGPRAELADLYERYVQQFGALNRGTLSEGKVDPDTDVPRLSWRTPTLGGFRGDPQFSSVLALELFDRETGEAAPAPFLQHRVNRAPTPIVTADSPAHALAVSLAEGGINLSRIAGLLRLPDADAAEVALGPLVFRDPHTRGALVTARDYLSGNVRRKLAEARAAEALDSARYGRNVRALEDVQPAWLTPKDIRVELGSPLLDVADVRAFCVEVFGMRNVSIDHDALTAAWELDGWGMSEAATVEFGTRAKSPLQILAAGLNGKVPIVYESVTDTEGRTRQVRDGAATEAATVALSAVADRFSGWVWEDLHRARRLEVAHNERFNAHRERVADGSWLPMPRLAPWKTLRANQSDWIDYALAQPASMCCTGVGSGKTLAAIGLAVTLRDLGIARKPMVAVPNHLIEQVTVEATQSFPSARFLIVTPNDLKAGARQLFAARCATQEWDAVIITHEGLESIPVPTAVEESWLSEQLAEARAAEAGTRSSKSLARLIRSLRGRLQELRNRGRNDAGAVTFDQLGIDHLGVDEFDKYRRMPVFSRSDGFSLGSSTRATDMYLKVWWLRTHHPHRPHFSGFTATPLVNTIAEAYVYMRFCVPEVLASAGLQAFDAWAATFIRWTTLIEMSPDGSGFRCKRRPAIIQNAPELRAMLAAFMYFNPEAGERGDIPKVRYHTTTTNPTDAARTYMNSLVARAERLRAGGTSRGRNGVPGDDNFLRIVGEGRRLKPTAQKRNSQPQLAVSPTSITAPAATDFPARTSSVALSW